MDKIYLSLPILTILPGLLLIPILIHIGFGLHIGGIEVLQSFVSASIYPSLDKIIVESSWRGLQITIYIAIISWGLSVLIGSLLGIISSDIFWDSFNYSNLIPKIIKRIFAIPRSIHELVWGLILLQFLGLSPWVAIIAITLPYSFLFARVISEQIDSLDHRSFYALKYGGVTPLSALTTSLTASISYLIVSYGGYRLECSLRGATLLGVFGLGGIGTELYLTLQSLEFRQMWTSLWMLFVLIIIIEKIINSVRIHVEKSKRSLWMLIYLIAIIISLVSISFISLENIDVGLISGIRLNHIILPKYTEIIHAIFNLNLVKLSFTTIVMTILSAGIAIGIPPLLLILFQGKYHSLVIKYIFSFLRLIPPPLTALLLLLCTNPSISVAALALGLNSLGVLGRLLQEATSNEKNPWFDSIRISGAGNRISWIYGHLASQSKSYLSYAAYRTDVLLRETAIVGVVGGVGLGWQLQESLSSFAWAEVILIIICFICLTLSGEAISEYLRNHWSDKNNEP